jgi:hypothetical protein
MNRQYTAIPAVTTLQRLADNHIPGSSSRRSLVVERSTEVFNLLVLHHIKKETDSFVAKQATELRYRSNELLR